MMPKIKDMGLSEFCDVFCEEGVFTIEESEYILQKAKEMGYKLKIHADASFVAFTVLNIPPPLFKNSRR